MGSEEEAEEETPTEFVLNCSEYGIQIAEDVRDWGDKIARSMGKRIVTGNCPVCHTTLAVSKKPIPDSTLPNSTPTTPEVK